MHPSLWSRICYFFYIDSPPVSAHEAWRSPLGAFICLGITGLIRHHVASENLWLLAPIGATTVLVFLMPHSPASSPRSVLGGYLLAALSSALAIYLIPYAPIRTAAAVALCIFLMARFNCVHPSAGAAALLLSVGSSHLSSLWLSLLTLLEGNMLLLFLSAWLVNRVILQRPYPYHPGSKLNKPSVAPTDTLAISHRDLDQAIRSSDSFVNVQENELLELYESALQNARTRLAAQTRAGGPS